MNDCAVDTNIALCILNPSHPSHGSVLRLLRDLREDSRIVLPPQACYEAYVVLTRPKLVNGFDLTPSAGYIEIDKLRRAFTVLPDPPELLDAWLDLCREHGVSGKPAHDARLAAYARLHGIETLITLNARDFARYGLRVIVP